MDKKKTIGEVAALWKKDKQQYVKQSTIAAYALILENHILPVFGDKVQLTETDVQAFALKKLQDGLSQKTVKDVLIVLKMIQKFGAKNGDLSFVEWSVKFPTEQTKQELEVLSINNQKRIMQYAIDNFTFRNLGIYICLSTGIRIGEVCALKWGDINIATETISINRTIERIYMIDGEKRHTEVVIGTPKTKNSLREIPMSKELLKIIRPLKKVMNDDYFILTTRPNRRNHVHIVIITSNF